MMVSALVAFLAFEIAASVAAELLTTLALSVERQPLAVKADRACARDCAR